MKRLGLLILLCVSCSWTVATGFEECASDTQCGPGMVCREAFCLPLKDGCRRDVGRFDAPDRIAFMAVLPLTQPVSTDGGTSETAMRMEDLQALRLAVEEANRAGGLKGRSFDLFVCDSEGVDETGGSQASWFVGTLGVSVLLTWGETQTKHIAGLKVRREAQTLVVSPTARGSSLSELNVWRVVPPDTAQAILLADLMVEATPAASNTPLAIVHEETDYGVAFDKTLNEALQARQRPVTRVSFPPNLTSDQITEVVRSLEAPDAGPSATVLIATPPDIIGVLLQAGGRRRFQRDGGHQWFFSDSARNASLAQSKVASALEGGVGTAPARSAGPGYLGFAERFVSRYGVAPSVSPYAAHSYDAMWLVMSSAAWASRTGAVTGRSMAEGMRHFSATAQAPITFSGSTWAELSSILADGGQVNVSGASGSLDFDAGATVAAGNFEVWSFRDGGIATLRVVGP